MFRRLSRNGYIPGTFKQRLRSFTTAVDNKGSTSALDRLYDTEMVLREPQKYSLSAFACFKQYQESRENLISDLLVYPRVSRNTGDFILGKYRVSRSIRALILQLLMDLMAKNDFKSVLMYLEHMKACGVLSTKAIIALKQTHQVPQNKLRGSLYDLILLETVYSGDPILAASFLVSCGQYGVTGRKTTISAIIRALSVSTRDTDTYNAYTILVLVEANASLISAHDYKAAIDYAMSLPACPYMANLIAEKYFSQTQKRDGTLDETLTQLVLENLNYHNVRAAVRIWNEIQSETAPTSTSALLEYMNEHSQDNNWTLANSVLTRIDLKSPPKELVDVLVKLYSTMGRPDQLRAMTRTLKSPLSRRALSALLQQFCDQNDFNRAQRITQTIMRADFKLTLEDMSNMVSTLIRLDRVEDALTILRRMDLNVTALGYVRLVDHVLTSGNDDFGILELASRVIQSSQDGNVVNELFYVALMHIHRSSGLRSAKRFYMRYSSGHYKRFSLGQLAPLYPSLKLRETAKLKCLQHLMLSGIAEEDHSTVKWAFAEMRAVGAFAQDIISIIQDYNSDYVERLSLNTD